MSNAEEWVKQAQAEFAAFALPYLCTIVAFREDGQSEHFGTGIRLLIGTQVRVVTCAHVLREARAYGNRVTASTAADVIEVRGRRFVDLVLEADFVDAASDLALAAYVDHEPPYGAALDLSYLEGDEVGLDEDLLFVAGFPGVKSRYSALAQQRRSIGVVYVAPRRTEELGEPLPPRQFALDYTKDNVSVFRDAERSLASHEFLDIRGVSGAPVWRSHLVGSNLRDWHPGHARIVGIAVRWEQQVHAILCVRIAELRPLINRIVGQ